MKRGSTLQIIGSALVAVCFTAVFLLSSYLEQNRIALPEDHRDEDLAFKGKDLKGYTLGFEGLLADWYWMQSLQYIGNRVVKTKSEVIDLQDLRPLNLKLLYPLLDNATSLDPSFIAAYSYGATVLPAVDIESAIRLTEKGIANTPDQWRLYQYLGYIYWKSQNYPKAAEVYAAGSKIPGAPSFMGLMASRMMTEGGSRDVAREMYSQMLAEAKDAQTRVTAETRLLQLDSMDERDLVNDTLKTFSLQQNRCVSGWNELLSLLSSRKMSSKRELRIDTANRLVDPSGAPYVLDSTKCSIKLGETSKIPSF